MGVVAQAGVLVGSGSGGRSALDIISALFKQPAKTSISDVKSQNNLH